MIKNTWDRNNQTKIIQKEDLYNLNAFLTINYNSWGGKRKKKYLKELYDKLQLNPIDLSYLTIKDSLTSEFFKMFKIHKHWGAKFCSIILWN